MMTPLAMAILLPLTADPAGSQLFPHELVQFVPYEHNPVFEGRGPGHWDAAIRERGWILREHDGYHLWYTGYNPAQSGEMHLGYATSPDGITWTRHPDNPIYTAGWTEDMMVLEHEGTYYMFAEGRNDRAHMLTSTDKIRWTSQGTLDIRRANGEPLSPGPFGTPTVYYEDGRWYLFYERDDEAIWLATSTDLTTWTNVQDEPVIERGPDLYDKAMLALDQIVKHNGRYYAYYHGLIPDSSPQEWTSAVAVSTDLVHWQKFPGNPILRHDQSSPILVHDGDTFRLYTMHPKIHLHLPAHPSPTTTP
jgi:beta-1,2-mannobiose phosphorylase / 1,2-beta-oligomannan phosphorylase